MLIKKITARAKELQKTNARLTWQQALKKAGAEFKGKPAATKTKRKPAATGATKKPYIVYLGNKIVGKYAERFGATTRKRSLINSGYPGENIRVEFNGVVIGKTKTNKRKKTSAAKHTDTKSHNVKINVTSGVRKKPIKFKRAEVDEHALNGIVKVARGKHYEIVAGGGKGSVFCCKSIKGKNSGNPVYFCRYYEKTGGKLSAPFDVEITEKFLNGRVIRGRGAVKTIEKYGL